MEDKSILFAYFVKKHLNETPILKEIQYIGSDLFTGHMCCRVDDYFFNLNPERKYKNISEINYEDALILSEYIK